MLVMAGIYQPVIACHVSYLCTHLFGWTLLSYPISFHSLCSVVPKLTLHVLMKELKRLTKPIKFGISLDIPQDQLEIIEQDHPFSEYIQCRPCHQ